MRKEIEEIIGEDLTSELRNEVYDLMGAEGTTINDIEECLLGYGLEMDYFEDLFF